MDSGNTAGDNITDPISSLLHPNPILQPTFYHFPNPTNTNLVYNINNPTFTGYPPIQNDDVYLNSQQPVASNANTGQHSDHHPVGVSIRNPKKRTRSSRRAPTTVLTTDTTNFRQMVQEFTGIPTAPFTRRLDVFGVGGRELHNIQLQQQSFDINGFQKQTMLESQNSMFNFQKQALLDSENPIFAFQKESLLGSVKSDNQVQLDVVSSRDAGEQVQGSVWLCQSHN